MKKFLALVLALVMVFALCACGQQAAPAAEEAAPAAAEEAAPAAEAEAKDYIECEPMTWKYACSATDGSCWADMGRVFGQYLSDKTNGAITVDVYPSDQLTSGSQTEGIQAVIDGTTDLCAHSNLIMSSFDQRLNVVSLPFIFESTDDVDKLLDTGAAGYEALAPVVEGLGLHLLGVAENGFRHPTNSVKPITCLADMKGMKFRVAGSYVLNQAYDAWGTNWANANWSEVYTALQQGTYDGQENPLPTAYAASVSDVQKYCTYWTGVYDCIFFCINQELYDSLSPEVQALVDEAGAYAAANQRVLEREGDQEVIDAWTAAGVEFSYLSDEAVAEFKEASSGVAQLFIDQCVELGFDEADITALVNTFVG